VLFFEKKNQKAFVCWVSCKVTQFASGDDGAGVTTGEGAAVPALANMSTTTARSTRENEDGCVLFVPLSVCFVSSWLDLFAAGGELFATGRDACVPCLVHLTGFLRRERGGLKPTLQVQAGVTPLP
jgi:hypothetical protein